MFSGEHLHSSEVNVTDQTRYALTFRFSLEPPRYGEGNRWYPYQDADWLDSGLASLAGWRSRTTPAYIRYLLFWRLGYWLRQQVLPRRKPSKPNGPPPAPEAPATFDDRISDLRIGEVRPLDAAHGIARTTEGTYVFPRYCPHAGADLTMGYLRDGQLHCAWHNLGFELATGASPCRSLARLRVTRLDAS